MKNRSQLPEPAPVGTVSAASVRDILVQAIHDVQSKKITPRTGGAISQLCNSLHRVLQTADLEARLLRLERQLEERKIERDADTKPSETPKHDDTDGETAVETADRCEPREMPDVSTENGNETGEDGGS